MANDRPPILGVVGRTSGQIRVTKCDNTLQQLIQPKGERATSRTATDYTNESSAYTQVRETGRTQYTVCHSQRAYAQNDDREGCEQCTAIPGKASGPGCGMSSVLFGAFIKSPSRSMWPSSNGRTTSKLSPPSFSGS